MMSNKPFPEMVPVKMGFQLLVSVLVTSRHLTQAAIRARIFKSSTLMLTGRTTLVVSGN